jgi:hypothetical protein
MNSLKFRVSRLLACASVTAALAAAAVQADELHVTAASASNNKAYNLNFAPAGATALAITPLSSASVRSMVYVGNQATGKTDLIAADQTGSRIVRYAGATGTATTIWTKSTAGPLSPLGLSADGLGNLYVTRGDKGKPELWVLKRNPAQPIGAGYLAPVKIDGSSFGTSTQTRLLETLVVPGATPGGLGAGDLLVLVDDGRVYRYAAAGLKSFLAGTGPAPVAVKVVPPSNSPPGHSPTGMALWPTDGSLLVTTVDGSVLRYSLTASGSTVMAPFATGLGSCATGNGSLLGLIKTFVRSNAAYAVLSQPQRNRILELGAPPAAGCPNPAAVCNAPLATISTISSPLALATTDSGAPTQDCVFTNSDPDHGCTLLGGAIKLGVSSANPGATIVDAVCTIDNDPRVDPVMHTCDGTSLAVETLCPGYGPTTIPGYLCGGSGPSGRGLSLIKSVEQNGFSTAPSDLLVKEELSADALLAPPNPTCPQVTAGWAPLTGEGTIPEANDMIELASYCGSTRILSPGHSLIGVGLQLNTDFFAGANTAAKLVTFANMKLDKLSATVTAANIPDSSVKTALGSCVAKTKGYLNDTVNLTPSGRYACAAHQAWTCDSTVNASSFGSNPDKLSAYSSIRGRLANLILTINTRLAGQPASTVWPLPDPALTNPLPAGGCDPDTSPPTAPANFAASTTTQTSITLNWQPSTDSGTGLGGYYLYRTGAASSPLATLDPCDPCSYTDSNLDVEKTYSYQLVAFDKSTLNNGGPNLTDPVSTNASTQPDTAAPNTPTVTLGTVTTTSVALSWTASIDPTPGTGIGGYYVYRGGNYLTTVTGTSFTDTALTPATPYSYQVAAFDKSTSNNNGPNVSALSAAVPATTLTPPDTQAPTTPTSLHYSYTGPTTLLMSWTASTDPGAYATGIGGYNVYLAGALQGSTTGTSFPITLLTTTSAAQFLVEVEAFDKATPTPNVSTRASVTVTCYDPDTDHDCDALSHHHD